MALDDIQMTVSIIQILVHLRHTDSNIGAMICHTFQTSCNVRKDKSHLYCTFTVSQSLYMTTFHFFGKFINHFFQRFNFLRKLHILFVKNFICRIYDIFYCLSQHFQIFLCIFGKFQSFLIKLLC